MATTQSQFLHPKGKRETHTDRDGDRQRNRLRHSCMREQSVWREFECKEQEKEKERETHTHTHTHTHTSHNTHMYISLIAQWQVRYTHTHTQL